MSKKPPPTSAPSDAKRVYIRLKGKPLTRWRELLREEGGTEQHHAQAALEAYCAAKGYGPKPTAT